MSSTQESVRWRLVDPEGRVSEFDAEFLSACDTISEFACVMAGCPDVFGWRLMNLDTGAEYVPEEIEAKIRTKIQEQARRTNKMPQS